MVDATKIKEAIDKGNIFNFSSNTSFLLRNRMMAFFKNHLQLAIFSNKNSNFSNKILLKLILKASLKFAIQL
uniref:Uncharacterized protein n=1 Tax=Romanomermis culicivorax TaxID=13658 RepID=A0A915K1Y1_ROMCU